jgi:uncharacterized protein (DUF305 family)
MNRISILRRALVGGAAATVVLVLAAGCGNGSDMGGMNHGGPSASSAPASATFNDADIQFAQMMIPHHQQAVEMASLADTRAADPEVKQIAAQIKAAQDPEIKTMTGWLAAWGQPTTPPGGHTMSGMAGMPGMMSDAEMAQLKAAKGVDFDRMFARMMIAHHNGAIQMARDEQAKGKNPDAKALAATIEKTQAAEVAQLQKILDRL